MNTADDANARLPGTLSGLVGMEFVEAEKGRIRSRLSLRPDHMAANGYLHAATVITLADTSCGFGSLMALPEGAAGFTTLELKANYLGTARDGAIACDARMVHGGRTTQVWDATVTDEATGRTIALFRCTQMVLWSRQ